MKNAAGRFVPYEKLGKKAKRQTDRLRRADWGAISPVTRMTPDKKVYNRKKVQHWEDDRSHVEPFLYEI